MPESISKGERFTISVILIIGIFILLIFPCSVQAAESKEVIPGGQSIGVSLNYDGVYVDDLGDIAVDEKINYSPSEKSGLQAGDIIKKINGDEVKTVDELTDYLNSNLNSGDTAELTVMSADGSERTVAVTPALDSTDGKLKLGIWAKDAASGVGTVTYFDPESKGFTAVGHEISDANTGAEIGELCGDVYKCEIVGVRKGERGTPGELIGVYSENKLKIGEVNSSSRYGIMGTVTNFDNCIEGAEKMLTASPEEVHEGEAYILSNVEGSKIEQFVIHIEKTDLNSDCDKDIIFKVTDDNLINKTGGIVRGMSGSPIIQDGKLVGSVTHVLINDPLRGYGVFVQNMQN